MKVSDTLVMMPNHELPKLSSSPGKDEVLSAQSHISRLADEIQEDEDSIERFNKVISNIDSCTDPKKKKILEKSRPEYNSKIKKVQIRLEHKYAELKRWEEQVVKFNDEQEAIELETQANKEKNRLEKEKEFAKTMDALDRAYRLGTDGLALRVENPNDPDRLEKINYLHPNEDIHSGDEDPEHKEELSPVLSHKDIRKQKQKERKERSMSNP
jgi:hypothetical protein